MDNFFDFLTNLTIGDEMATQTSGMDMMHQYAETHHFDLSDSDIVHSVETASEFFNIEMPAAIQYGEVTGVCAHLASTMGDDILYIDPKQMEDMNITDQQAFDLVMTHEGAHRALQGLDTHYNSHQEELCCDMMAGIRAGLNGIPEDAIECMKASLADTQASDTHPEGTARVEVIDEGVRFAKEYYELHHCAPSLYECIDHFNEFEGLTDVNEIHGLITLRPEDAPEAIKEYSQQEINSRMHKAKNEMDYWKSQWEKHLDLAKHDMWRECELSHARSCQRKYEEAKQDYNHWKYEKPDDITHAYTSTDINWLENKVRITDGVEQSYWLEKLDWVKSQSLDISQNDLDSLNERAEGLDRDDNGDSDEIKGYSKKVCPTRHGCSGATSCDCSYGDYPW